MVLPAHIKPMLATAGTLPADQDRWAFELKWDGIRAIAYWDGRAVRFESRNLRDITRSWPELAGLGERLGGRPAILDGEIVALDDRGVPSFQRLQERMHVVAPPNDLVTRVPAAYFAFDVLHLDDTTLMAQPWTERRAVLEDLDVRGACWATPPAFVGEGDVTVAAAEDRQLEGVVAKRLDSAYVPGQRSRLWTKVKRVNRNEFVVGGWTPGEGRRAGTIGSLALGVPAGASGGLRYVGNVGTGFTDRELRRLESVLAPTVSEINPFTENVQYLKRGTVFVAPTIVTDVEYTEMTNEGILRHPSYKGERIDKSPGGVNTDPDKDRSP
ncbi:MAG TPA: non-homologous end-joining DNA ligase [Acidimicrobiales bacterium]|nr:non-homologous end-joining DNA ligase [Acidimicrobiales bacterium]